MGTRERRIAVKKTKRDRGTWKRKTEAGERAGYSYCLTISTLTFSKHGAQTNGRAKTWPDSTAVHNPIQIINIYRPGLLSLRSRARNLQSSHLVASET